MCFALSLGLLFLTLDHEFHLLLFLLPKLLFDDALALTFFNLVANLLCVLPLTLLALLFRSLKSLEVTKAIHLHEQVLALLESLFFNNLFFLLPNLCLTNFCALRIHYLTTHCLNLIKLFDPHYARTSECGICFLLVFFFFCSEVLLLLAFFFKLQHALLASLRFRHLHFPFIFLASFVRSALFRSNNRRARFDQLKLSTRNNNFSLLTFVRSALIIANWP
mmetsp:Transcript_17335/g.30269  ORF Transcript_17335/g.30269 Transcript_17335/m.30269 type:complete len:221 (+) Transcript_17335:768-1430(+)